MSRSVDGHRLVAIVAGSDLKLISRNGYDRAALFREPFEKLAGLNSSLGITRTLASGGVPGIGRIGIKPRMAGNWVLSDATYEHVPSAWR